MLSMIILQITKGFLLLCFGITSMKVLKRKMLLQNAFGNPISIKESFDLSLEIIVNGIKSLEGVK